MPAEHCNGDQAAKVAAVASISELPADDVEAYVIVVVRPSGLFRVTSDMCCVPHTAALLAAVASDLMTDLSAEHHILSN